MNEDNTFIPNNSKYHTKNIKESIVTSTPKPTTEKNFVFFKRSNTQSNDASLSLQAFAKKNIKPLPINFANDLLEYEFELEKDIVDINIITKLTELYTLGMGYYAAINNNNKVPIYQHKLKQMMNKPNVIKALEGNRKKEDPNEIGVNNDNQETTLSKPQIGKLAYIPGFSEPANMIKYFEENALKIKILIEKDLNIQIKIMKEKLITRRKLKTTLQEHCIDQNYIYTYFINGSNSIIKNNQLLEQKFWLKRHTSLIIIIDMPAIFVQKTLEDGKTQEFNCLEMNFSNKVNDSLGHISDERTTSLIKVEKSKYLVQGEPEKVLEVDSDESSDCQEDEGKLNDQEDERKLNDQEDEGKLNDQEDEGKLNDQKDEGKLNDQKDEGKLNDQRDEGKLNDQRDEGKLNDQKDEGKMNDQEVEGKLNDQKDERKLNDQKDEGKLNDQEDKGKLNDQKDEGKLNDQKTKGKLNDQKTEGKLNDQEDEGKLNDQQDEGKLNDQKDEGKLNDQQEEQGDVEIKKNSDDIEKDQSNQNFEEKPSQTIEKADYHDGNEQIQPKSEHVIEEKKESTTSINPEDSIIQSQGRINIDNQQQTSEILTNETNKQSKLSTKPESTTNEDLNQSEVINNDTKNDLPRYELPQETCDQTRNNDLKNVEESKEQLFKSSEVASTQATMINIDQTDNKSLNLPEKSQEILPDILKLNENRDKDEKKFTNCDSEKIEKNDKIDEVSQIIANINEKKEIEETTIKSKYEKQKQELSKKIAPTSAMWKRLNEKYCKEEANELEKINKKYKELLEQEIQSLKLKKV